MSGLYLQKVIGRWILPRSAARWTFQYGVGGGNYYIVFSVKYSFMNCHSYNSCCFISGYVKRRKYLKLFFISRLRATLGFLRSSGPVERGVFSDNTTAGLYLVS